MLMKLAIWASLSAADAWNERLPASITVSPEAASRLPNVLAGTATVAVVAALTSIFFGPAAAVLAAFILALDPNVTALNRVGKEDTLMVLFLMLAISCYERAKIVGALDPVAAQRWYYAAGIGFGLMLASKYVPWFFGYFAVFNTVVMWRAGANAPRPVPYNLLILAAFVAANFAVLLPETWAYCAAYLRGDQLMHHGLFYDGEVYMNTPLWHLDGVPPTYYLRLIATKVPLPVLAAAAVGLVPLVTRRRERGFVWLRVFLVLPIFIYSIIAAKFQRYALPTLVVIDVLAAVGLVTAMDWIRRSASPPQLRLAASLALPVGMVALLAVSLRGAAPFYPAYQNTLGAWLSPPITTFPEEAYDYGVREAVAAAAASAGPGTAIVSDASIAVEYYVTRSGRHDLEVRELSRHGIRGHGEEWILAQDSHIYLENASLVTALRRRERPWREYRIRGTTVLQVFR